MTSKGDISIELFVIRAICDVAADYAVGAGEGDIYANNPGAAFDRLSIMIQLIQERVAELEDAVNNS